MAASPYDPLRQSQDRNAWVTGRLDAQLESPTVRSPEKRLASGPLPIVVRDAAAPPTAIAAQRLLLQSQQVAAQLALVGPIAGPGSVD